MAKLLTTEDLLERLHICRKTLDNHVARGELPQALRVGRRRYWPEDAFEAFISKRIAKAALIRGGRHA